MSLVLRLLTNRVGSAKSRLRRNLRERFERRFDESPDREWSRSPSRRHAFHDYIRQSIDKLRIARAMREEFRRLRGAQ